MRRLGAAAAREGSASALAAARDSDRLAALRLLLATLTAPAQARVLTRAHRSFHSGMAHAIVLRARGALRGALVADAASYGLHWVYDAEQLETAVKQHGHLFAPITATWHSARGAVPGALTMYVSEQPVAVEAVTQPARAHSALSYNPLQGVV